ncbi:hypothetical protein SS50377_21352 [Spironucleus salmonicida]|uniref:Transmembrane protein n=1 Tax=Spironucleus salmonicida TaxID=348837 RepID=A0A9P8S0L9_9EUKA|nr:hypothetical protein SS50377_21352 [Spironucleus salmonicida]
MVDFSSNYGENYRLLEQERFNQVNRPTGSQQKQFSQGGGIIIQRYNSGYQFMMILVALIIYVQVNFGQDYMKVGFNQRTTTSWKIHKNQCLQFIKLSTIQYQNKAIKLVNTLKQIIVGNI